MNVISSLMDIAANPVTRHGKTTTAITYDSNCLEEICGSCAMLINGKARMACSALVDKLEQPVTLEPFSKFPVVRDLAVDRSVLFENLKKVKAWVPVDGTYDLGPGPAHQPTGPGRGVSAVATASRAAAAWRRARNSTIRHGFVGAATICASALVQHPSHRQGIEDRTAAALMGDGGIQECGYAQNCVEVCPKDIL